MRPVDKGTAPNTYARYEDAASDLRARLGDYCSYCERQIETGLAVEHVLPKERFPAHKTRWTNFVLSCVNCNSCKGQTRIRLGDYIWPHKDNSLRAYEYTAGGLIDAHSALPAPLRQKATSTLRLIGLDKIPGRRGRVPTQADKRWLKRTEVWRLAQQKKRDLLLADTPQLRSAIIDVAVARGLFSIWWTIFDGDVDMRRRLRLAFIGTHPRCFDAKENTVPRAGGQL